MGDHPGMTAHLFSAGLAAASATAYALASALQHHEAARVRARPALDPGLLAALGRRPWWLAGLAADVAAVALQALALRHGPVTLVQPVLVVGLPVAVLLSCAKERRPPRRHERDGALLCTIGLCLVVPVLSGAGGGRPGGPVAVLVAAGVLTVLVLGLLRVARVRKDLSAVATGAAAGTTVGAGGVLLAVCADGTTSPHALLLGPAPYLTVLVGLLGLLLSQAAFQTGALGPPLAALVVAEPVVAVVLGIAVLHERVHLTPAGVLSTCAGCLLAVAGVAVLSRRPAPVPGPAPGAADRWLPAGGAQS